MSVTRTITLEEMTQETTAQVKPKSKLRLGNLFHTKTSSGSPDSTPPKKTDTCCCCFPFRQK